MLPILPQGRWLYQGSRYFPNADPADVRTEESDESLCRSRRIGGDGGVARLGGVFVLDRRRVRYFVWSGGFLNGDRWPLLVNDGAHNDLASARRAAARHRAHQ
jgi:hypothetical protein